MYDGPVAAFSAESSDNACLQADTDADGKTYHSTLGVSMSASQADIRQAYRRLAGRWHPDKWARFSKVQQDLATAQFAQIAEAYANLTK